MTQATFSELLEEFIDMRIEGLDVGGDWISIEERYRRQTMYHTRLQELREALDNMSKLCG